MSLLSAEERFSKAVKISEKINKNKITEEELGKVYGLYKQSLFGDCDVKTCPNIAVDYIGYKKWHNWNNYRGKNKLNSMNEYADLIIDMADKYGLKEATKK